MEMISSNRIPTTILINGRLELHKTFDQEFLQPESHTSFTQSACQPLWGLVVQVFILSHYVLTRTLALPKSQSFNW